MVKIKDIGDFESVPAIVNDILQGNTEALDEHLSKGFDIEEDIKLGKYTRLSPLDLALIIESFDSVKWLVENTIILL